jgi:V8-like Glu-specific endopeptidase
MRRTYATTALGSLAILAMALSTTHCIQGEITDPHEDADEESAVTADIAARGEAGQEDSAPMLRPREALSTQPTKYAYLVSPGADASVLADVSDIASGSYRRITSKAERGADEILIEYFGKGRLSAPDASAEDYDDTVGPPSAAPQAEPQRAFILFSPRSRNEFRVHLTEAHFRRISEQQSQEASRARAAAQAKAGRGGPGDHDGGDVAAEPPLQEGWSNNNDSRARTYGVNASVGGVNRWMVHFSNTCSGAQVGTSTVITAGHCLWNRASSSWNSFTLRVGRNGTSVLGTTTSNIKWYLVPPEWQDTNNSDTNPYDIGFVVMSDDLKGGTFDGQSHFIPKLLDSTALGSVNVFNRGYPACNNFIQSGVSRIDEPCQGLANQSCTVTPGVDTCAPAHVYGDTNSCSIGNFSGMDADGWNRNYQHSCDASAGQSGSVLYALHDGEWSISAVHFLSLCGKTATDTACTSSDARPLRATRITPTYLGYYDWLMSTKD